MSSVNHRFGTNSRSRHVTLHFRRGTVNVVIDADEVSPTLTVSYHRTSDPGGPEP